VLVDDERRAGRLDTFGAVTGTGGVVALAYGLTRGGEHGWADTITLTAFAAAAVLLVAFVVSQARSAHPLLPLRLLADRNRTGAYVVVLFVGAGLMGTFYLATLFMQQVLAFGPLRAGAAALPFGVGIILASGVASKLVEKLSPRAVAAPGLLLAAGGMFWLSTLEASSGYWTHLMAPIFLTSAGLGLAFVPMTLVVVHGVASRETGVASALLNTAQQIGAALGLALLTTVATIAAADHGSGPAEALAHGYGTAYLAGGIALLVAAALVALLVTTGPQQERQ
jgi:predicted MFS family arabinose efflux permease